MPLAVPQRLFSSVFGFGRATNKEILGVDISPERISVALIKKQGNRGAKLTSFHSIEMPEGAMIEGRILDPQMVGSALVNLISENKIKATFAATAVPAREAIVRLIRVPAELAQDELRRVVLDQEAELYIPYPRDQADVDFQVLGLDPSAPEGMERNEVLLVAVPKEVVDNYLEALHAANLKVRCIELASFSLIRTIRDQLTQFNSDEAVVLTAIGFESTEISILVSGIPQFTRTVNIGTIHMQQVLAQALNLPTSRPNELLQSLKLPVFSADTIPDRSTTNPGVAAVSRVLTDLADELRRSVDFYANQERSAPVVKVLLAGSGAGLSQVDGFMAQRLSIPVELADPLSSLDIPDAIDIPLSNRPAVGVALGLGLRDYN